MPDVTLSLTNEQLTRIQLAAYVVYPTMWAIGEAVVLNENTNAVLVAGDGAADNALAATDAQIASLINVGKPAADTQIKRLVRIGLISVLDTAQARLRDRRAATVSNQFMDNLE